MAREIVKKLSHVTENRIICQNFQRLKMGLIFNDEKSLFLSEWMMNTFPEKSRVWLMN